MKKLALVLCLLSSLCFAGYQGDGGGGTLSIESDPVAMASISNMVPAYGNVGIHDGAVLSAVSGSGYTIITNLVSTNLLNMRATATSMVVNVTGMYFVDFSVSMILPNANSVAEAAILVNGVEKIIGEVKHTSTGIGDYGGGSAPSLIQLYSNDVVQVGVNGSAGDYTWNQVSLVLARISPSATTYIAGAPLEQTVTTNTATVPSSAAVQVAISNAVPVGVMLKSGNTTNIIIGLTNAVDYVKMTYTGGILTFTEAYNGVTNTYNSLNN